MGILHLQYYIYSYLGFDAVVYKITDVGACVLFSYSGRLKASI